MSNDEINDLQCALHFLAELLRGGNPKKACATEIMPEGAPGKSPTWIDLLSRAVGTAHYMDLDTAPLFRLSGAGEATLAMVGEADAILSQILLARSLGQVAELHRQYVIEHVQPFAPDPPDPTILDLMGMQERKIDQLDAAGTPGHSVATSPLSRLALELPVFPYWPTLENMAKPDYDRIIAEEKPLLADALLVLRRLALAQQTLPPPAGAELPPDPAHIDYIDMDQAAALVNRSKKTLERALEDGGMPQPDIEGGGGKKHEWKYAKLRPWLEKTYGRNLRDRPPHAKR